MAKSEHLAIQQCEDILTQSKSYNIEHSILPSENIVIDRLLEQRENMAIVYSELVDKLNYQQIDLFLSLVLSRAAFWNPEKTRAYREGRKSLIETNAKITEIAAELSCLLERRDELNNSSGFYCNSEFHIANLIERASFNNPRFGGFLKEPLKCLRRQFDFKYWPSLKDIINVIANDAGSAEITAADPLTDASTTSIRESKKDFLRALFAGIDENSQGYNGLIPKAFKLSHAALAEIMNCALDLDADELVDAGYIKRALQDI
ncbi:hypothetical protein [Neptuniibacter sp. QD48_11]|uniref:hypothetical protein n=1 Tax=Neptuniibacter sp. QD48_11 TaxID=3398211 RepID=UPI0039F58032